MGTRGGEAQDTERESLTASQHERMHTYVMRTKREVMI